MSFGTARKPSKLLELRPVQSPGGGAGAMFVLLPSLEQLLGDVALFRGEPILIAETAHAARRSDGWAIFGTCRERGFTLN
jgi:hypothetical protein